MESHKLLVFDIWGEYGHFRKFNTTSSPLTYSIPTRSALAGILGAILGIEREIATGVFPDGVIPVNEVFSPDSASIAIQVLNPIKKVNIGFNLLNTKSASSFFNIQNRTQIEFELLKHPKFRIFFDHTDETVFKELSKRIHSVSHHFTPYLGLSQFTASIEWIEEVDATFVSQNDDFAQICTAVNLSNLITDNPIRFAKGFYSTDTFPMVMQRDRVVTKYAEILIEKTGEPIWVKTHHYFKTTFGNILFL
ncbi:MAG: type I-B CRISPR-associated protein Cas5b [Bacteroidota bacterium]